MDETEDSWQSQNFRFAVREKIKEFFGERGVPTTVNIATIEEHVFQLSHLLQAETKDDYIDLLSLLMYYVGEKYSTKGINKSSFHQSMEQNVAVNAGDQVYNRTQNIANEGSSATVAVPSAPQMTTTTVCDSVANIPMPSSSLNVDDPISNPTRAFQSIAERESSLNVTVKSKPQVHDFKANIPLPSSSRPQAHIQGNQDFDDHQFSCVADISGDVDNKRKRIDEENVKFEEEITQQISNQNSRHNVIVALPGSHDSHTLSNAVSSHNEPAIPAGNRDTQNINSHTATTPIIHGQNPNLHGSLSDSKSEQIRNLETQEELKLLRFPVHHSDNLESSSHLANKPQSLELNQNIEFHHHISQYHLDPDAIFKDLPFYEVKEQPIRPTLLLPSTDKCVGERQFIFFIRQKSFKRQNMRVKFRICPFDSSCRQDDVIPSNFHLKVNTNLVLPESMLKNKLPIDITRLMNGMRNVIEISWVSDSKKPYVFAIFLVKIKFRNCSSKNKTKAKIKKDLSSKSDISTMSLRASLMCPIGKTKMELPCRTKECTHIQCFDATSCLKSDEREEIQTCPICDAVVCINNLVIDYFFVEIIRAAKRNCTEVLLHEDASWKQVAYGKRNPNKKSKRNKGNGLKPCNKTIALLQKKFSQNNKSEITLTRIKVSLVCPLGKIKMKLPCRAAACTHLQCFDAAVFMQMNEKKSQRKCPVCDKLVCSDLVIDDFFTGIIRNVPPECTDVELYENGSWTPVVPVNNNIEVNIDPMPSQSLPINTSECVDISKTAIKIENFDSDFDTDITQDLSPPQKKRKTARKNI